MTVSLSKPADESNHVEDLSGINTAAYANPYDALIDASGGDTVRLQSLYATHRTTRNSQQREKLLSPEFPGLLTDPILQKLADPSIEPGFEDPRHCLVFWARPPSHIRLLAGTVQQKLQAQAPHIWLMPLEDMHLTVLEVIHSVTDDKVKSIIAQIGPDTIAAVTEYTYTHRTRLIKPILSYDAAAVALSFVPAAGEGLPAAASSPSQRAKGDDTYTYHHLRRDVYDLVKKTGIDIGSRYVVPTSHITLGRFISQKDHDSPEKMEAFIKTIEEINAWLEKQYWGRDGDSNRDSKEWMVGQEKGLVLREGKVWYGGGQEVRLGKGF